MLRWLCLFGLLVVIAPAHAQEAATLGKLPEVYVLTALKSGDWEDLGDLIGEALDEVDEMADERDLKLSKTEVVIYEMAGLKNFRARIGYLLDPETKAKPGRFGKNIELRQLKGPAYVASGIGGAAAVIKIRRKVLGRAREARREAPQRRRDHRDFLRRHGRQGNQDRGVRPAAVTLVISGHSRSESSPESIMHTPHSYLDSGSPP